MNGRLCHRLQYSDIKKYNSFNTKYEWMLAYCKILAKNRFITTRYTILAKSVHFWRSRYTFGKVGTIFEILCSEVTLFDCHANLWTIELLQCNI